MSFKRRSKNSFAVTFRLNLGLDLSISIYLSLFSFSVKMTNIWPILTTITIPNNECFGPILRAGVREKFTSFLIMTTESHILVMKDKSTKGFTLEVIKSCVKLNWILFLKTFSEMMRFFSSEKSTKPHDWSSYLNLLVTHLKPKSLEKLSDLRKYMSPVVNGLLDKSERPGATLDDHWKHTEL